MGLLLLLFLLPAFNAAPPTPTPNNCNNLKDLFSLKNITDTVPQTPTKVVGGVCGGESSCCTPEMESTLERTVTLDLHNLLHHNFRSLHGMLATTGATLHDEVKAAAALSQNKTLSMLEGHYKGLAGLAHEPALALYKSLLEYIGEGGKIPTELPTSIPSSDGLFLERTIEKFLGRLFPSVYHVVVLGLPAATALQPEYQTCLEGLVPTLHPFGDHPQFLAKRVAHSFEMTRVLLQALSLGVEVLNATDTIVSSMPENTESCRKALLKLHYCPKCLNLPWKVKPCNGYCLNVMRGCLTQQRVMELDLPWSNFLLETEKLVREIISGPTIEHVLLEFTSEISDAILYAALNGPSLEKQVKKACGSPKTVGTAPDAVKENSGVAGGRALAASSGSNTGSGTLTHLLNSFLVALEDGRAKGFYANLAEALCSDKSFAETRDTADCWNGNRIGEYTKVLVRPGLDAQKYNPELKWVDTPTIPAIQRLSDKLRHMRQVVLGRFSRKSPESDSMVYLREGSGSGDGNPDFPEEDDDDNFPHIQGSGSGQGAIDSNSITTVHNEGRNLDVHLQGAKEPKNPNSSPRGVSLSLVASLIAIVSTRLL